MKLYDYLIVGSGLYGATFAYRMKCAGKRCLVIEKRPFLGGNLHCQEIEGIHVHEFGPHIFHTNSKFVWDFVNSFVEFNRFVNAPLANYKGKLYNLPFNMNTFYQMWGIDSPEKAMAKLNEQKTAALFGLYKKNYIGGGTDLRDEERGISSVDANRQLDKVSVEDLIAEIAPKNLEEQALLLVGKDIFEILIKEYTEKQWGRSCKELPPFIIKRLPVRLVFDNNYFNDRYQGIPIGGYNKLIDGLLRDVECYTGKDFFDNSYSNLDYPVLEFANHKDWRKIARKLVYTGPLDAYFGFIYGRLDWRTVSFKTRVLDTPNFQGNAVINYTSHDVPFTRIIEHKHFELFGENVYSCPKTVISEEYSAEYKTGMEPYYPVNDDRNNMLAERYRDLAQKENDVIFGGRLGEYKYYDMAPIIEQVFNLQII